MTPEEASRTVRPAFICCYLMVLCVALHLLETQEQIALGYSAEEAKDVSKTLFTASQGLLFASGFLSASLSAGVRDPSLTRHPQVHTRLSTFKQWC